MMFGSQLNVAHQPKYSISHVKNVPKMRKKHEEKLLLLLRLRFLCRERLSIRLNFFVFFVLLCSFRFIILFDYFAT